MRPWKPFSKTTTAGRPVAARAILTAFSIASAPELTRIDFWRSPAHGRVLGEPAADLDVRLVGADHEALVQEAVDLLVDRRHHRREAVARVLAGDPAREVEVERPVGRLDLRALGARDDQAGRRDAPRDEALARFEDVVDRRALAERHAAILSRRSREAQWTGGRTVALRSSTRCRKDALAASAHTA